MVCIAGAIIATCREIIEGSATIDENAITAANAAVISEICVENSTLQTCSLPNQIYGLLVHGGLVQKIDITKTELQQQ